MFTDELTQAIEAEDVDGIRKAAKKLQIHLMYHGKVPEREELLRLATALRRVSHIETKSIGRIGPNAPF